jgi:type I restriction enzyme S subunit
MTSDVGVRHRDAALESADTSAHSRWRPYPEYKDSGVEWLGEIPAHWELSALRRKLFRQAGSIKIGPFGSQLKLEFMTQDGFKVYGQEHVIARDFDRGSKYIDQAKFAELAACEIRPGDLVVTMMGSSGHCAVVPVGIERGIMDSHLLRIRLPDAEIDPRFLCLLIDESNYVRDQIGAYGKGAIMHGLNSGIIKSIVLAVPPTSEQLRILSFLHRETARIDALVAKKERLIGLLREKRTALITQAATKGLPAAAAAQAGLDPNVRMKHSGVEWLGEIPAHWDLAPVYARYEVALGKMLDAKRVTGEHPGPYLRNVDVQWGHIDVEDLPQMDFAPSERDRYSLRPGDLLVCEGGEVGRTAIWRGELEACFYQKAIHRVRPLSAREQPRYFYYIMYSAARRGVFIAGGNPNTIDHLTAIQLRHYRFPFPPEKEQTRIANFLDDETSKIDALIGEISIGIGHLMEFRTALTSAAVTGKIDVREEAA